MTPMQRQKQPVGTHYKREKAVPGGTLRPLVHRSHPATSAVGPVRHTHTQHTHATHTQTHTPVRRGHVSRCPQSRNLSPPPQFAPVRFVAIVCVRVFAFACVCGGRVRARTSNSNSIILCCGSCVQTFDGAGPVGCAALVGAVWGRCVDDYSDLHLTAGAG